MIKLKDNMASISLSLTKNKDVSPIEKVEITWSEGISLKRLIKLLKEDKDTLLPSEREIWNTVKDKEDWLYCYSGHIDTDETIKEYYLKEQQEDALRACRFLRLRHHDKMYQGLDVKLDFGKVDDQTIETRLLQHLDGGDYLENFRRDAVVYFPVTISPYKVEHMGDYIDSLETILIKGHKESTYFRLGVCNKKKKDNPQLLYPIKSVTRVANNPALEKEITVNIEY